MHAPHLALVAVLILQVTSSPEVRAAEVVRFDFDTPGDAEGWDAFSASREVADGVLRGLAATPDPQLAHDAVEREADVPWDAFRVRVRELDHLDDIAPYTSLGVVLIFNTQEGTPPTNFGPPTGASEPDGDGFRTLTWDLASFEPVSTGRIRVDVIGGPETVRPDGPNNRYEVDWIELLDAARPEQPEEPS